MNPNNPYRDEWKARIAEIDREIARLKNERDWLVVMTAPQGESILDILAEYEKEIDGEEGASTG